MNDVQSTIWSWATSPMAQRGIAAFIGAALLLIAMILVRRSVTRLISSNETRYRLRKVISLVGYLAIGLFLAATFSDRLGQFGVAFGVAGAGIAFALQEVIVSLAGWIAVSIGGYYAPGDRIQLAGIRGDVIDVGALRTTLMECGEWVNGDLYTGRIVRIANGFIFKEPVFNYSADFAFLWDEIVLPIKYGSDYNLARQLMHTAAEEIVGDYARQAQQAWSGVVRKYLIEAASVEPAVTITADSNSINFTLRFVVDYKRRRSTKDLLFQRVLELIDENADRVGISASTLNIEKVPPMEISIRRAEAGAAQAG